MAGKYPESDVQGQNFPASIGGESHINYVYHKARVTVNGTVFEFPLSRYDTWVFDNYITPEELPGIAIGVCVTNAPAMGFIAYFFVGNKNNVEAWLEYARNK